MVPMPTDRAHGIYRFGAYEADPRSGELRKSGVRLRLQEQPFQVLLILLDRPNEVVTREELRQQLWPANTFVDFDHSLNTVINKLREVLSDSAANPRFVETLARRGYRFLQPVEFLQEKTSTPTPPSTILKTINADENSPVPHAASTLSLLTRSEDLPAVQRRYVRALFLLLQIMYLSFYLVALARLSFVHEVVEQTTNHPAWVMTWLISTAMVGLPIRFYFISAVAFDLSGLTQKFLKLFPITFPLDELWALSPFLLTPQIGIGMALAVTAALIYVPFAQRTLLLMADRPQPAPSN
jgi:cholera toxin transcriptional activator